MKLVVASDIFGITAELVDWLGPIVEACQLELELVSPYPEHLVSTKIAPFENNVQQTDEHAYQSFLTHGGLELYTQKVLRCVESQQQAFFALGFSAGAAAIWQVSATSSSFIKQAVCFYGGQIRFSCDLPTQAPTTLIWAEESHFDVEALHQKLRQYPTVNSMLTNYPHGFINQHSAGFQQEAANHYQSLLIKMLMLGSE